MMRGSTDTKRTWRLTAIKTNRPLSPSKQLTKQIMDAVIAATEDDDGFQQAAMLLAAVEQLARLSDDADKTKIASMLIALGFKLDADVIGSARQ